MIKSLFLKFKRFITFGIVGCINTLVDFLVFTLCHGVLLTSAELGQAVGYASGVICSFILNRNFTFRDGKGTAGEQLFRFLLMNFTFLALSTLAISFIVKKGINAYMAKVIVTLAIIILNYFGYKHIVFKLRKGNNDHE